jgi:hypothetical protein
MADKVQLTLETLVPEMDVLVQKGYFEKKDVKKIMKKRRYHEYQFEKTDVLPLDYFRAIKYEKILNKRMKQKKKSLHIKKNDYYDFHFIRRIIVLYKKCLIKFNNNNENIWMEYFNFLLVNKCNEILNKEIGRCLTMHPTKIIFWKIAAYHEYEDNLNFQNARNLLQKCIKLNKGNLEAYLEYFTFELIFAENLTQRKNILSGNAEKDKKTNENKKKKINMVNDILSEKEKMDIETEKKEDDNINKNDDDKNSNNDDIKNLIIPEVIYDDAINKLIENKKTKKVDDILLFHFGFLEKLEKYGTSKNLNYQNLENKIINNIKNLLEKQNELFLVDNEIKIIKIKLLKYKNEESLNKLQIIFNEFDAYLFVNKNKKYFNYISYHFLQYCLNEDETNENNNINLNENNEAYIENVTKLIKSKINIEYLNKEILLNNNIKLLLLLSSKEYFIKNILIPEKYNIYSNIFDVFKLILQKNDLQFLKDIFIIFNNIKNDVDSLLEKITKYSINFIDDNNCYNFLKYYIDKIIELISDEVTYYIKPELMKNYFEMINNQFLNGKANYIILKELYSKMLELIVDKCVQINENDKNEDGKKYYEDAYNYIKNNMKKLLINRNNIKNDIINKKTNNSKTDISFLKWIE